MTVALSSRVTDASRARVVMLTCALLVLAFGVFAVLGAAQDVTTIGVALFFFAAAMIMPLSWVALSLAALIPLQFYFPLAASLSLRGALVFVIAAALRVMVQRVAARNLWRWPIWMVPATLFLFAALIGALDASNRYWAFKGIYDWLPIFAAAFVVGEIVQSERLLRQSVIVLILAGIAEAALGLVESALSLSRVVDVLALPTSAVFFQPNILRERLTDLSFNWVLDGRVVPFGTFINGIDFAIFIAAVLSLVLAGLLGARRPSQVVALLGSAVLLGTALVFTFKGSGLIALAGGVFVIVGMYLPRLSQRAWGILGVVVLVGIIFVALFSDPLIQRVVFLIQRELGLRTETGRTAIWMHLLSRLPERPLFGFGLNNATLLVPVLPSMVGGAFAFNTPAAESAYVAALIETGIVGFSALILFLLVGLKQAYQNAGTFAPIRIGVLAAIVAVLLGNLTVQGLTTDQNGMLLGVLFGLTYSLRQM